MSRLRDQRPLREASYGADNDETDDPMLSALQNEELDVTDACERCGRDVADGERWCSDTCRAATRASLR